MTRVVVIAFGVGSEHIELLHHSFSCFANIALMQVDDEAAAHDNVLQVQVSDDPRSLMANRVLARSCPTQGMVGQPMTYSIARGARAERSVIDAVEHVKRLARGHAVRQHEST
ncbi:hypothetical protein [Pseudomonas sp. PSKL.D1]|uniref:hypothetical protein n=1 Tax=Pseudomonas sp. PSKL.D1 TaxID=3029060 RepID=UPI0023814337|nr:hypothetical protein [Pseudomonas sp. PSKL.D1]WDY56923.1 hypothetical protein PVV54_20425 [Pseudomonas sp. PSKL.D1]